MFKMLTILCLTVPLVSFGNNLIPDNCSVYYQSLSSSATHSFILPVRNGDFNDVSKTKLNIKINAVDSLGQPADYVKDACVRITGDASYVGEKADYTTCTSPGMTKEVNFMQVESKVTSEDMPKFTFVFDKLTNEKTAIVRFVVCYESQY